ncbi:type II toxin-antitoxin system YhaV family toxin [Providencia sp. 2024EL-00732]|uniref:type II toxin-antitoxin system YhaV family toxin n=2 Tax=Providencia TaxID=586 RepID=UPI00303E9277
MENFFHSCFLEQLVALVSTVQTLKKSAPIGYKKKAPTKLLAAINKVITERIAVNPLDPIFYQGNTLGTKHKHWFRAKFLQQFRLFFRCSEKDKIIIISWVNDFSTLRSYSSKNDAYQVFASMLSPPDDWETLSQEAKMATKAVDPNSAIGFLLKNND